MVLSVTTDNDITLYSIAKVIKKNDGDLLYFTTVENEKFAVDFKSKTTCKDVLKLLSKGFCSINTSNVLIVR